MLDKSKNTVKSLLNPLNKSFANEYKYVFWSGVASFLVMLVFYMSCSIAPFGDNTIYKSDLYHQYGPFFTELYDRLTSGESLVYSWNTGLGNSFIGNFFNYLSSPFGIFVLFFERTETFDAIAIMILVKSVLSSMSMSYYLKKSQKHNGPMLIAFGIMYAFSAYFIAYYWNIMWMDSLYLFPFVILGLEELVESGKCTRYIIALAITIITNYYIAFMVCIFSCIYFLYYYICPCEKSKSNFPESGNPSNRKTRNQAFCKSCARFAFSSIAAVLLVLWMLVPVAQVLMSSSATTIEAEDVSEYKLGTYFNIFDFLANHLAATRPTLNNGGNSVVPNVYSGILTLILIPVYFLSKNISKKEKIASAVVLILLYLGFSVNVFDFIWHGFHVANQLPYRQSFMYSFILLIMAFKAYLNLEKSTRKMFAIIGGCLTLFIIIVAIAGSSNVTVKTVIVSLILVVFFSLALFMIKSRENLKRVISIFLVCLVAVEAVAGVSMFYKVYTKKTASSVEYKSFKEVQSVTEEKEKELFYRVEAIHTNRIKNASSWYDFYGVSGFSSMAYEHIAKLQKSLGVYSNNANCYVYNPQTPVYNAMFSIKYIYNYMSDMDEGDCYTKEHIGNYYSYKNNYWLPLAYCVSDDIVNWNAESYESGVEAQEKYFYYATGIEDVFLNVTDYSVTPNNAVVVTDTSNREITGYTFTKIDKNSTSGFDIQISVNEDTNYYLYISSEQLETVSVNSTSFNTSLTELDRGHILDLGGQSKGDVVSVEGVIDFEYECANVDFCIFTVDNEKFSEGYNQLKDGQLVITEFEETSISGTFVAEENEILYTSIPYDVGWTVYIDGEEVDDEQIIVISDALIGVSASAGQHEITFEYTIPGMAVACLISFICLILLIAFCVVKKRKQSTQNNEQYLKSSD